MSSLQGSIATTARAPGRNLGLKRSLGDFWRDLARAMFDTYRPERHYMRGPGPACAAKRAPRG